MQQAEAQGGEAYRRYRAAPQRQEHFLRRAAENQLFNRGHPQKSKGGFGCMKQVRCHAAQVQRVPGHIARMLVGDGKCQDKQEVPRQQPGTHIRG